MGFIMLILTTALLLALEPKALAEESFVRLGRKFSVLGDMKPVVGDWALALVLNLGTVYGTLDELEYQVKDSFNSTDYLKLTRFDVQGQSQSGSQTENSISMGLDSTQKNIRNFRKQFRENVELQRSLFLKEISDIREELRIFNYVQSQNSGRVKRGFVTNAIGSVLRQVTGVATDSDVKLLQKKLLALSQNMEQTQHIASLQTTVMNDIAVRIEEKNKATLETLKRVVKTFKESLKNVVLDVEAELSTNMAIVQSVLDQKVTEVRSELALYTNFVQSLLHDLILLVNNKIPHSLIHPEKLYETLKSIKLQLTAYDLAIPVNSLLEYYNQITCTCLAEKNILVATCHLPLVERSKQQFTLYKTESFPTYFSSNASKFLITDVDYNLFAVSGDHRYWTQFSESELEHKAIVLPHTILVPQNFLMFSEITSCNVAVFLNETSKIERMCTQKLVELDFCTFERLDDFSIVVSSPSKNVISVSCPDSNGPESRLKTETQTINQGTYIINSSPICDVSSKSIFMKGKIHRNSEITVDVPKFVMSIVRRPDEVNSLVSTESQEKFLKIFDEMLTDLENTPPSREPINLNHLLALSRKPEKFETHSKLSILSIIISSLALVGFIMAIYYAYFLFTRVRKLRNIIGLRSQNSDDKSKMLAQVQNVVQNAYAPARALLNDVNTECGTE